MRQRPTRPRLIQAMMDAFRLPDLRKRILFTFAIAVAFRFVAHVPLPGVDTTALRNLFNSNALLGMLDLFSGGALRNFSVAAMGVYPYITSTIILQLLQPVIPRLQQLAQEGEAGRDKMNRISHWLTVPLAGISGYGQIVLLYPRRRHQSDGPVVAFRHGHRHDCWHHLSGVDGRADYGIRYR